MFSTILLSAAPVSRFGHPNQILDLFLYTRYLSDIARIASVLILVYKVHTLRNCEGISFKTQALYFIVFVTRYLDLIFRSLSPFNTIVKIFFIVSSCYILYLIRFRYLKTSLRTLDTFPAAVLVLPFLVLFTLLNSSYTHVHGSAVIYPTISFHGLIESLWYFSVGVDSVAILPQLHILRQLNNVPETLTWYLVASAMSRVFYLPTWTYKYFKFGYIDIVLFIGAIIHTALHLYTLYVHFTKIKAESEQGRDCECGKKEKKNAKMEDQDAPNNKQIS